MARVVTGGKRAAIDPLKHSAPLGGALVFLGLAATMPIMHGSQGCASFAKALLTRHFREPIPLQTTAVTEVTAVIGAGQSMVAALDAIRGKQRPQIIGLLTTGLTEVSGEDVAGELRSYIEGLGADAPLIVGVSTPDFRGGLSDGYAAALEALVLAVPLDAPAWRRGLAVFAGAAVNAADADEISELVTALGLDPILVPNIAASLDGHLDGFSPVTTGGTSRADLEALGDCGAIVAIGKTAAPAAAALSARTGADAAVYAHLCGLESTDAFVRYLMSHSDVAVPSWVRRWRSRLADGLLDIHFVLGGARVALAAEPDL
ncbi:MAG: nitrogenase iron-molybdenum cofactor biosynthesis protein NifN, partial [Mycobacterium sp.]|nr:nitrogenase iron-molybdenum cofactor biosynthesis protein NifN [Mycobacterium sp.]